MNFTEKMRQYRRDPLSVIDFFYWAVRGIRVIAMKEAYENDRGTLEALKRLSPKIKRTNLDDWAEGLDSRDAEQLAALFKSYGSDKATKHDYYRVYAHLLKDKRALPISIFEIGLGTNNTDTPSNMGAQGKPGASLRGFRDWAPNASVVGADVDKRVLFEEERIKTYYLDQTRPETMRAVADKFRPNSFDLIIDDGLHNSWANLNTLEWALGLVKDDGYFVIEDIVPKYIDSFDIAAALLKDRYDCELVKCRAEWVFIAKKK